MEVLGRALADYEPLDETGVGLKKGEEVVVLDYDATEKPTFLKVRAPSGQEGLVLGCVVEVTSKQTKPEGFVSANPKPDTHEKEKPSLSWARTKIGADQKESESTKLQWARRNVKESPEGEKSAQKIYPQWQRRPIQPPATKSESRRPKPQDPIPFLASFVVFFLFILFMYDIILTRSPFLIVVLGFMPRLGLLCFQLLNLYAASNGLCNRLI